MAANLQFSPEWAVISSTGKRLYLQANLTCIDRPRKIYDPMPATGETGNRLCFSQSDGGGSAGI